jgi:hypothetical protein
MGLFRTKLSIFQHSPIPLKVFNPLKWWVKHDKQFLYLGLLAHQVMGIVGSQIKIE